MYARKTRYTERIKHLIQIENERRSDQKLCERYHSNICRSSSRIACGQSNVIKKHQ